MDERENNQKDEELILAWVRLTCVLKNSRLTEGLSYNEAIVMLRAYNRFRQNGEGVVSFKEISDETHLLKSHVHHTIEMLVEKGLLERVEKGDRRMSFVRLVPENLEEFLRVHRKSLALAHDIHRILGEEDTTAFLRIAEKICSANPLPNKD